MCNYRVKSDLRCGVEVFTLQQGSEVFAEVVPELGNNCIAFCAPHAILEATEFTEFLKKPTSYGMPILCPFPNRIKDGKFLFQGKHYTVNPSRHGFIRDKRWNVDASGASDEDGAWVKSSLAYEEPDPHAFPFRFFIEVTYRLRATALEMEADIINVGSRTMPLGFGIHPYFRRPARGSVQIPSHKRWKLLDNIPTGDLLHVIGRYDLRKARDISSLGEMDDIFTELSADADGFVRCILNDHDQLVQTVIEFSPNHFRDIVVYTPAGRQAICIEPYSCPTDAFNLYARGHQNHHVILLEANQMVNFKVRIYTRHLAMLE